MPKAKKKPCCKVCVLHEPECKNYVPVMEFTGWKTIEPFRKARKK